MSAPTTERIGMQWRALAANEGERSPDEFAPGAAECPEGLQRREFLRLAAASLALAGAACTKQPREAIVPYVRQPEALQPGRPLFFATAMEIGGQVHGLLVRSREGRPIKIEGNPEHPGTLGRSNVHMQAALLDLYDPTRSQTVLHRGQPASWKDFLGEVLAKTPDWKRNEGAGLRLVTGQVASPALHEQIAGWLRKFPKAKWIQHDAAFPAQEEATVCRFDQAEVILALDADFLGSPATPLRDILHFAERRRSEQKRNRFYVVESMPSLTGAMADHRRALRPSEVISFATELLAMIQAGSSKPADAWTKSILDELLAHRGRSLVLAGAYQPAEVSAAAKAINEALGNVGKTVEYRQGEASQAGGSFPELVAEMAVGKVEALVVCGVNPAWTSPADLDFAGPLANLPFSVHLGSYVDETAGRCIWHVPESHFLEAWGDLRSVEGYDSVVQPLIEPLYASRSPIELIAALNLEVSGSGYDLVRASWQQRHAAEPDFEAFWRKVLHDGVAPRSSTVASPSTPRTGPVPTLAPPQPGLELVIRPDSHLLDGRYAHNGWLQELPRPMTKLTWENAAHLSPRTATEEHLAHGDVVEIRYRGRMVVAPVWVLPGHADGCVTVHLGHGRDQLDSGFDAYALQMSDALWGGGGAELHRTGRRHEFATTQSHQEMAGRDPVRLADARVASDEAAPAASDSLYPPVPYERPAWGMVIDLATCIGCSACTIACQAENNIPVVGRDQVLRGREMHWIRVDRYYEGDPHAPAILHQPVPCMHCENAPCELVCPVAATVHDHQGLNLMVYNRCIGTRYCSNNCPYKVRRFNFLQYTEERSPQMKMARNPEVTVRMRGVMEKCTYCVQRIAAAQIAADKENRLIRDGEVVPACAQACPADAIVFGDINDPQSRVAALRRDPRKYDLLGELNTRPRTTYLAKLRNPNTGVPA